MLDDIVWIYGTIGKYEFLFFLTDTYLYKDDIYNAPAKLIYSTCKPFRKGNISKYFLGKKWYSVVNRKINNNIIFLTDKEIQKIARIKYNIESANLFDANLSKINSCDNLRLIWSIPFISRFNSNIALKVCNEIASFYQVDINEIKITGGSLISCNNFEDTHDLDIIIKIDTLKQLEFLSELHIPHYSSQVIEYGVRWPLRWRTKNNNKIVCPFFIYGDIKEQIYTVNPLKNKISENIKINNDLFGIFNMPIYSIDASVKYLIIRNRIVRDLIKNNFTFRIFAPLYKVTSGMLKNQIVAVITNPWVQIENFSSLISHV